MSCVCERFKSLKGRNYSVNLWMIKVALFKGAKKKHTNEEIESKKKAPKKAKKEAPALPCMPDLIKSTQQTKEVRYVYHLITLQSTDLFMKGASTNYASMFLEISLLLRKGTVKNYFDKRSWVSR